MGYIGWIGLVGLDWIILLDEGSNRRKRRLSDNAGDGGGVELCPNHLVDGGDIRGG